MKLTDEQFQKMVDTCEYAEPGQVLFYESMSNTILDMILIKLFGAGWFVRQCQRKCRRFNKNLKMFKNKK